MKQYEVRLSGGPVDYLTGLLSEVEIERQHNPQILGVRDTLQLFPLQKHSRFPFYPSQCTTTHFSIMRCIT